MKPLIIANWKMNKTLAESVRFVQSIGENLDQLKQVDVVICPPFLSIVVLDGLLRDSSVALGAQNVSSYKSGAYTGEVSAAMLQPHCQYVIIGHSERRRHQAETPEVVNEKVKRAIEVGLIPIVCVSNDDELSALTTMRDKQKKWIIAFEPIEAIGSGEPSDPEMVKSTARKIRKQMGSAVVLYGGSTTADNIKKYLRVSDGALVGGSSLAPTDFLALCSAAEEM